MTKAEQDIENLRQFADVYLGGSRRMEQRRLHKDETHVIGSLIKENTDWDYYATHESHVAIFLQDAGWVTTDTPCDYYDSEAVMILKKDDHQIVLRKDANFYNKVFENIPLWFYTVYLWKRNPCVDRAKIKPIMEMFYSMAKKYA